MRALDLDDTMPPPAAENDMRGGQAGRYLHRLTTDYDKAAAKESNHAVCNKLLFETILKFLGFAAARLDELEERLSPSPYEDLSYYLDSHTQWTAVAPGTHNGEALRMIANRLNRLEGRARPSTEEMLDHD